MKQLQNMEYDWCVSTIRNTAGHLKQAVGFGVGTNWPTANKAYYVRIYIPRPIVINNLWFVNGTAASGNVDTGIYNGITLAKIVSTGSIARAGTTQIQKTAINPTLLLPGNYLLAHASDTTTNSRSMFVGLSNVSDANMALLYRELSAFPLPATATPIADNVSFFMPVIGGNSNLYGG